MIEEIYEQQRDNMSEASCFQAYNNSCYAHFHSSIELVYINKGMMSAMIDGQRIDIAEGELLIVSGYAVHRYFTETQSDIIVTIIPLSFIPTLEKILGAKQYKLAKFSDPENEFGQIMPMMAKSWETLSQEGRRGYCHLLLSLLIDRVGLKDIPAHASGGLIRNLLLYMQQHYTNPLSMEGLAKEFGYSRSRLSHLFRHNFGCSFSEYIHSLRCRQAAQLLKESDLTILEISMRTGFECVRTFYRAFRQCYGLTPTQYINNLS